MIEQSLFKGGEVLSSDHPVHVITRAAAVIYEEGSFQLDGKTLRIYCNVFMLMFLDACYSSLIPEHSLCLLSDQRKVTPHVAVHPNLEVVPDRSMIVGISLVL